jgi:hypothetical protein
MGHITYPDSVPDALHAGDSFLLEIAGSDYPASEWTTTIVFSNSLARYTANSSSNGNDHRFNITPTTTEDWTAGNYNWQIYFSKTGYRVTHATGRIKILADIADASAGTDIRSFPRKIADALESIVNNRATKEQLMLVSLNCKDLNVNFTEDVYLHWSKWTARAEQEEAAGKVAAGMGRPTSIYARFVR